MKKSESVVIDPVAMGITNRIARGGSTSGPMTLKGGLMLQGVHQGDLTVAGHLVVCEGAGVSGGVIAVAGDVFVLGRIGGPLGKDLETQLGCSGTLHLTRTSEVYGDLRCARPAVYEGAKVFGQLNTRADRQLVPPEGHTLGSVPAVPSVAAQA